MNKNTLVKAFKFYMYLCTFIGTCFLAFLVFSIIVIWKSPDQVTSSPTVSGISIPFKYINILSTKYSYDSTRVFNGDGNSIRVFEIEPIDPKSLVEDHKYLHDSWKRTPVNDTFIINCFKFANPDYGNHETFPVESWVNSTNFLYSIPMLRGYNADRPNDIDLWVIDVERSLLYYLNHNI